MIRAAMTVCAVSLVLAACGEEDKTKRPPPKDPAVKVSATVETAPMRDEKDAADDPAIWVDAANPGNSVVIGTNKKSGLGVYGLDGAELSFRPDGRMNNVDIRQNVMMGGQALDIVVASNRTNKTIDIYKFDGATRTLAPLMTSVASNFPDPYGICLYHNAKTGALDVFMNDSGGMVGQWRLSAEGNKFKAEQVRTFMVGAKDSQAEGCAADDQQGLLFVAEEDVGLYAYDAEDPTKPRVVIDKVDGGHLTADAEGVAVVVEGEGGYLIVSSQGSNSYNVYDRAAPFTFRGAFQIADAIASNGTPIDGVEDTDGLDVTSASLGSAFPGGVFVAQDGANFEGAEKKKANQNFKLVPWPAIRDALKLPAPAAPKEALPHPAAEAPSMTPGADSLAP